MAWSLGSVIVHPGDSGDQFTKIANYAIQQPLDSTAETITFWSASSQRRRLQFVMFENENSNTGRDTLEGYVATDANVALTTDEGAEGNFRILSLSGSRRQDLNHTQPTWIITAEMIKV